MATTIVRSIRPQPYRIKWPLSPNQVEGIDEMLQILFKRVRELEDAINSGNTGSGGSSTVATLPPGLSSLDFGRDGEDFIIPVSGAVGATGVAGAAGPPGPPGEDDDSLWIPPIPPPVEYGLYTPNLTNTTNLDASTAFSCQWLRVGLTVTVSGRVDVDPTAAGNTVLGISLPIPSNFANNNELGGTAFASGIAGQGAALLADATNDRATMQWVAVDTTNQPMFFTFTYRII